MDHSLVEAQQRIGDAFNISEDYNVAPTMLAGRQIRPRRARIRFSLQDILDLHHYLPHNKRPVITRPESQYGCS